MLGTCDGCGCKLPYTEDAFGIHISCHHAIDTKYYVTYRLCDNCMKKYQSDGQEFIKETSKYKILKAFV